MAVRAKPGQSDIIGVERFVGAVDQNVPLFNRDTGILKRVVNMRVKPGGYLEARGGYEELKPSGGTTASVDANGFLVGLYEHVQSHGCIIPVGAAGATFGEDIALFGSFTLWGPVDLPLGIPPTIGTGSNLNAWHFGSSGKFSRLRTVVSQGAGGGSTYTVIWEYSKGAGVWGTLTGPTEDFKTAGTKEISWALASDWLPMAVNNIFLYWVRCRILVTGVCVNVVEIVDSQFTSDWPGRVILFAATAQAASDSASSTSTASSSDSPVSSVRTRPASRTSSATSASTPSRSGVSRTRTRSTSVRSDRCCTVLALRISPSTSAATA